MLGYILAFREGSQCLRTYALVPGLPPRAVTLVLDAWEHFLLVKLAALIENKA